MKILCIGHAAYDITIPVDGYPKENTKNRINEIVECGGGPAATAAYLLAKWKMESYFAGVIGNDLYGNRILKEFNDIGVHTNFLEINKNIVTSSSFIVANKEKGTRTILTHRPTEIKMAPIDFDIEPNVILVDGQEIENAKIAIQKFPDAISIMDAGATRKGVMELIEYVDYLICSKDFAEEVTGIKINYNNVNTLVNVFVELKKRFNKKLIITLESYGCLYEDEKGIRRMPSIVVKAVDSTGAGDAFHGAFAYGIANGFDIEKSLKYANIAGALSVTKIGSRYSMPTLDEVEDKYATLK